MNRKAATVVAITQNRMAHASQIIRQFNNANLNILEAPITIEYTQYSLNKGQSSLNAINILFDLLVGRLLR